MGRTEGLEKRKICEDEWHEGLGKVLVRKEDMNRLVMDYLVTEGYLEAAKTFQEEAEMSTTITLQSIEERDRLRQAIQDGEVATAITLINEHNPELMDQEGDLTFYLRQQQTIELITQDKIEEALEYAETHLAPLTVGRPDLHEEMENTVALLVLKNVPDSAVSHLATGNQRYQVARRVNEAVLRHHSQGDEFVEPRLAKMLRMVAWAEKELDKHCDYPHLKDIAS